MDWLRRNPLVGVLAAVSILLAVVIAVEAEFGVTLRDAMRPASGKPALPTDSRLLPPAIAMAPEQAYPETTARPLFIPTRRPAPELAAAPQSAMTKGQFVLAGVITVGDNRTALLREKSNGRIHRVERGKEVNGMKIADIQREQVTLALGGEQEVLNLAVLRPSGGASMGSAIVQGPFAGITANPGAPPPPPPPGPGVLPSGQMAPGGFPAQGSAPVTMPSNPSNPIPAVTGGNPAARAIPEAAGVALTPEELLARRRARRTQQNQNQ